MYDLNPRSEATAPAPGEPHQRASDAAAIDAFLRALFRYAAEGTFINLRAFYEGSDGVLEIKPVELTGSNFADVSAAAAELATQAASCGRPTVFCPPIATFRPPANELWRAREQDLAEGLALSVECDSEPGSARCRLTQLLGPPTVVVESGGMTEAGEPKLHLHWRLSEPTESTLEHANLKEARALATSIVGGDASNVPMVHPIRWPGSWHCKEKPRQARIVELNDEAEIDLDEALAVLRDAAPAARTFAMSGAAPNPRSSGAPDVGHRETADLIAAVQSGADYHGAMVSLSARYIAQGMNPGAVVALLKALMEAVPTDRRDERWQDRVNDIVRTVRSAEEKFSRAKMDLVEPVDLWARYEPPLLPAGLLPQVLEEFVSVRSRMMGVDPGGLAMSVLTVCAAAIPDTIRIQVKRHDLKWLESARIWASLVGDPSTKKTPIISLATAPLKRIDSRLYREWKRQDEAYQLLPKDKQKGMRPPLRLRLRLEDVTIEYAQEVLKDSPNGVLCTQDELAAWFGSMEKYSGGGRGAAKDRGFWLQAFNGGEYTGGRISRGDVMIPNLSVSLLGGIQPDVICKVVADSHDDGLIQRLFAIVLRPASADIDAEAPDVDTGYGDLIERLYQLALPGPKPDAPMDFSKPILPAVLRFDDGAQKLRRELADRHHALASIELVNKKLAAHIGKLDGMFARLCVLWHCIEHAQDESLPAIVGEETARRVATFLADFLLPHAVAFYAGVLGLSDEHERVIKTAGYILSRGLGSVAGRDVQRGDRTMRGMGRMETQRILEQLEAFGWLEAIPAPRNGAAQHWAVNPAVHRLFADRGKREAERRRDAREAIRKIARG